MTTRRTGAHHAADERQGNAHEDFVDSNAGDDARDLRYGPEAVLGYDPDDIDDTESTGSFSPYLRDRIAKGKRVAGAPKRGGRTLDDGEVASEPKGETGKAPAAPAASAGGGESKGETEPKK